MTMSPQMNPCPKCGDEASSYSLGNHFRCGSMIYTSGVFEESPKCKDRQIAQLTRERDELRNKVTDYDITLDHFQRLAAAVDYDIHARLMSPRSRIADARLQCGDPMSASLGYCGLAGGACGFAR